MLFDMHFKLAQAWMELAQVGAKAASEACLAVAEENARSWERIMETAQPVKSPTAALPALQWPFWPMLGQFAPASEPQRPAWSAPQPWNAFWSMLPLGQMMNALPAASANANPASPMVAVTLSWPLGWPLWQMPGLDAAGGRPLDPFATFRSASGYATASIAPPVGAKSAAGMSAAGMPWWNWMTPMGRA